MLPTNQLCFTQTSVSSYCTRRQFHASHTQCCFSFKSLVTVNALKPLMQYLLRISLKRLRMNKCIWDMSAWNDKDPLLMSQVSLSALLTATAPLTAFIDSRWQRGSDVLSEIYLMRFSPFLERGMFF